MSDKLVPPSASEDCICYTKSHTPETCPKYKTKNITHPLRYYEFTQDEIRVLEECDRESFYRRCLPLSTLLATATYAAVKNELVCPSIHFGAVPKVLAAALLGHVLGRLSYISTCACKFRQDLPTNSYLGNVMRKYESDRECKYGLCLKKHKPEDCLPKSCKK